jgi:hypothetical protein
MLVGRPATTAIDDTPPPCAAPLPVPQHAHQRQRPEAPGTIAARTGTPACGRRRSGRSRRRPGGGSAAEHIIGLW